MDFSSLGGLLFAIIAVALGAFLEEISFSSLLGLSAFLIVVGGSVGAGVLSHSIADLKELPRALKLCFFPEKMDYTGMIDTIGNLAEKARRNGLLALQEDAEQATNPFIKQGMTMAVDGADPEVVEDMLVFMNEEETSRLNQGAAVLSSIGGYSPTLGILGTVMGLVKIMANLSEPDTLGPAIGTAFKATLYGVGFANLIYLPLAAKIKSVALQRSKFNEMVIQGVIGVQSGENPRNLREKLAVFVGSSGQAGKSKGRKAGTQESEANVAEEGA